MIPINSYNSFYYAYLYGQCAYSKGQIYGHQYISIQTLLRLQCCARQLKKVENARLTMKAREFRMCISFPKQIMVMIISNGISVKSVILLIFL